MLKSCCNSTTTDDDSLCDDQFRRVLWIALWINAFMFVVELVGAYFSGSVALFADSADFLGDTANYGVSLLVLPLGALWVSRAALLKGITMSLFGAIVIGFALYNMMAGNPPKAITMSVISFSALIANLAVAYMLYSCRNGNANKRSVWLCSRNDAIANIAVMLAAAGVFVSGSRWPDLIIAVLIGFLALSSGITIIRAAKAELEQFKNDNTSSNQ